MKALAIVLLLSAGLVALQRVLPTPHRVALACDDDGGDGGDDGDDGDSGS